MATKEFTTYMHERTQDFFPDGPVDFGITRKNDGTVKKVRVWRFGAQATTGEPVPAEDSIDLTNLEDDDGTILPTDDVADTFLIEMEEGQMRWIKFNNGGGRIIGSDLLLVPGNVINLAAGDMIQVVGMAGGITQVLQHVKAVGTGNVEGVPPIGWIELDTNPDDGDTKDINGITVTFKNSPGAFPDVQRGADAEDTTTNLVAALNAATDEELTTSTYVAYGSKTVIIHDAGTDGNAFDLTGGTADFTTSDSTLTGGVDGIEQTKSGKTLSAVLDDSVTINNSDTLVDTDLTVDLITPGRYKIEYTMTYSGGMGIQFQIKDTTGIMDLVGSFPGTYHLLVLTGSGPATLSEWTETYTPFAGIDTSASDGFFGMVMCNATLICTEPCSVTIQVAQRTPFMGDTFVHAGSSLEIRPLF